MKLARFFGLAVLIAITFFLAQNSTHGASATFVVNKTADAPDANPGDGKCKSTVGGCTLRAAVEQANANADANEIYLKQGLTFVLNAPLNITSPISLYGASNIIQGNGQSNLFEIDLGGLASIQDVTLEHGSAEEGGALRVNNSSGLYLRYVTVRNNTATARGGAIMNYGALTIEASTLSHNAADSGDGGAIYNDGTLQINRSTFDHNTSTNDDGGAIYNAGTANLVQATLNLNQTGDYGGAIFNKGAAHLYNTTIVHNKADADTANAGDGGGIYNNAGTLSIVNSIVTLNTVESGAIDAYDDCGGTITSDGYNLFRTLRTCTLNEAQPSSVTDASPLLSALANNGGRTQTLALQANSIGIDMGKPTGCRDNSNNEIATDQRGYARSVDGNNGGGAYCDTGSFEYNSPDPCQFKPNAPALATPANNASSKQRAWLVSWSAAPCADSYKVTVKQDSKTGMTVNQISGLVGTHFVTNSLPKHHTYFVQLQACNAHGCTKSAWTKFTVQ